jgi:hypothetical protein
MGLISLESVKNMIWDPGKAPTEFDQILTGWIDDIIDDVEDEVELKFNLVTEEIFYANSNERWIFLPHANISNILVWVDYTKEFNPGNLIDSSKYEIDSERGIVKRCMPIGMNIDYWGGVGSFYTPSGNYDRSNVVKVQYNGGYTPGSVIIGSDSKYYTCLLNHMGAANNYPITGANWTAYWAQEGEDGVAWVLGTTYTSSTFPRGLKRALIMQLSYNFRRRKDIGLTSMSYPNGSVGKFSSDRWLAEVMDVLNNYRRTYI